MLRAIALALCLIALPIAASAEKAEDKAKVAAASSEQGKDAPTTVKKLKKALPEGKEYILMELKDGPIAFELYRKVAPNTVENFVKLTEKGFYEGLTFHRVIKGFMAQGGCPDGNGLGGPGYTVDAEFSDLNHQLGTVAMARTQDPNSAGSQFYIVNGQASHLDGKYTIFGQVVQGMPHVMKIGIGDKMSKVQYVDKRASAKEKK